MTDYQKYVNDIKNELLAYQQQDDYYMEAMRNSLSLSNVYSELWGRAMQVKDEQKQEELMLIVKNVKRAKQVYDLMLNRFHHANSMCARQIAYNKALIEYIEKKEAEEERLNNNELALENDGTRKKDLPKEAN